MSWSREKASSIELLLTDFVRPVVGVKEVVGHSQQSLDVYRIFFKFPRPEDQRKAHAGRFFLGFDPDRLVLNGSPAGLTHFFPCEVQAFINCQLPGALYRYQGDPIAVDGSHRWENVSEEDLVAAIQRRKNGGVLDLPPALQRLVSGGRVDDLSRVLPGINLLSVNRRLDLLAQAFENRAQEATSKASQLRQRALVASVA